MTSPSSVGVLERWLRGICSSVRLLGETPSKRSSPVTASTILPFGDQGLSRDHGGAPAHALIVAHVRASKAPFTLGSALRIGCDFDECCEVRFPRRHLSGSDHAVVKPNVQHSAAVAWRGFPPIARVVTCSIQVVTRRRSTAGMSSRPHGRGPALLTRPDHRGVLRSRWPVPGS